MKRFILIPILLITIAANAQLDSINIGTGPNSKNGDPIRSAFSKVNRVIERINTLSPSESEIVLPSQVTVNELPENYIPDTLLVLSRGRIYFTTKDKLSDNIYPNPAPYTHGTYFVANNGSDSNDGSFTSPFFTLNKAWTVVAAGDTIYMRGGIYEYPSQQRLITASGNASDTIKVWAYPGEHPIIEPADVWTYTNHRAGLYITGDYLYFKGITISGFSQRDTYIWTCMRAYNINHCKFENMEFTDSGLGSYVTGSCVGNLFKNCDWHDNYDPITAGESGDPYENADGLNFENITGTGANYIESCRFWNNADDGLDLYGNDVYTKITDSWAFANGFREDQSTMGGDGNGFKLGGNSGTDADTLVRIQNCVAYGNAAWGFNENASPHTMKAFNNSSYDNNKVGVWGGGFHFNKAGVAYYLKNNLTYSDDTGYDLGTLTNVDHNSWDLVVTVSDADFASLAYTQLYGSRSSTGVLPTITFMKLVTGSDLINKGTNVGLPYLGAAPDLGYSEKE